MTQLDIMAALEGDASDSNDRCIIQRWLDDIPEGAPGKAQLVEVLECGDPQCPDYRTLTQTQRILRKLGKRTSDNSIGNHRSTPQRCRCSG